MVLNPEVSQTRRRSHWRSANSYRQTRRHSEKLAPFLCVSTKDSIDLQNKLTENAIFCCLLKPHFYSQCRRQDALWPDSWTDSWTRKEAGLRLQRTLDQKTRVRRHLSLGQAKFSLLFASFYLADAPCLRLCGSLIIITIMLKWQNGKLCAKCIKFIANWPGQWQNRFVFVIVSVSALLAHVFFFANFTLPLLHGSPVKSGTQKTKHDHNACHMRWQEPILLCWPVDRQISFWISWASSMGEWSS